MIERPTVLILGAGASAPYKFPSGQALLFEIANGLKQPGSELHACVATLFPDIARDSIIEFGSQLRASHHASVDAFLSSQARQNLVDMGKSAIAASLLKHEKPGELIRQPEDFNEGKWYTFLFQQMGATEEEFEKSAKNLSIITFNYDRSIEYALLQALKNSYGMGYNEIAQFIEALPVIHTYGSLGILPEFDMDNGIPYKDPTSAQQLILHTEKAFPQIQILPEDATSSRALELARFEVERASIICFLGFGFHTQNLERLFLGLNLSKKTIFATLYEAGRALEKMVFQYFRDQSVEGGKINLGINAFDAYRFLKEHPVFL